MGNNSNKRTLSSEDELYQKLTGEVPIKAGTAYERLATAATMLMFNSKNARHDVTERGISGTSHQLDGVIDGNMILEAKDHTISGEKVNLNELQNHQGAMLDLNEAQRGFFASATGYTKDATQYAEGTDGHPRLIKTDIADIRHSTPDDEKGRIKEISVNIECSFLATEKGKYNLIWDDKISAEKFNKVMSELKPQHVGLSVFFDDMGNYKCSISDILNTQLPKDWDKGEAIIGTFLIDAYIKVNDYLLYVDKIKYCIPVDKITDCFVVMKEGDPCLLFECESLGINKLITNIEMKEALSKLK